MNKSVNDFFSSLHRENLKPLGFTKIRHTFSRDRGSYTERIQFQGSAWNASAGPWRFYVNFGVEFHDLPPRNPCRDFPATHCWARLPSISLEAPDEHNLPQQVPPEFARELANLIQKSSDQVARTIQQVRAAYESKTWPIFTSA